MGDTRFFVILFFFSFTIMTCSSSEEKEKTDKSETAPITAADSIEAARQAAIVQATNRTVAIAYAHTGAKILFQSSQSYALKAIRACEDHAEYNTGQTYKAYADATNAYYREVASQKSEARRDAANYARKARSDYYSEESIEAYYQIYQAYEAISAYIDAAENALTACKNGYNIDIDRAYRAYADATSKAENAIQAIEQINDDIAAKREAEEEKTDSPK